jgi:hypothetical protein
MLRHKDLTGAPPPNVPPDLPLPLFTPVKQSPSLSTPNLTAMTPYLTAKRPGLLAKAPCLSRIVSYAVRVGT